MRVMYARIGRKLSSSLGGEDSQVLRLEVQHETFVGGPVMAPGVLVEPILGPGDSDFSHYCSVLRTGH